MGISSRLDINNKAVLLIAISLLALLFGVYDLRGESLWLDEVLSVKYASSNLSQIFSLRNTTPPLYYFLLHWWIHLFGTSEVSVRFPSVICGFLSVIAAYKMGKELFDANTGTLSALLITVSVCHVQYSQEARTYSLSILLTILSMYYFIQLLNKTNKKPLFGYVLFSILLVYSHIYGLFIIIAQNIYFAGLCLLSTESKKLSVKKWFSIQLLLLLLFTPWLGIFLHEVAHVQKGYWISKPHVSTMISSFKMYSSGSRLLLLIFFAVLPLSFITYEKLRGSMDGRCLIGVLESFQWKIRLSNINKVYFLLMWLMTPLVLPFIISRISQPMYVPRYTIVASPAFFLLVAAGITNMHSRAAKSITIGIALSLSLIQIGAYYSGINKEQWRDVAEYIGARANRDDILLVTPSYYLQPFNYYYRDNLPVETGFPEDGRKVVDEKDINKLRETVAHYNRVWLVLSDQGDKENRISDQLMKFYNLSQQRKYKDIRLYLFERD